MARSALKVEKIHAAWRSSVVSRLTELLRLEHGWDGYQGRAVSLENAMCALQLLDSICGADGVAPQIVPGSQGDLQIEWHSQLGDVEVHVIAPNQLHAWRFVTGGPPDGEDLEGLSSDFTDGNWTSLARSIDYICQ
jgi:hypothetical protein